MQCRVLNYRFCCVMISNFVLSSGGTQIQFGGRGLHWARWRKLCKQKQYGGMGFESLLDFNRSMLAEQILRIIRDLSLLLAHILKARYFKYVDILDAKLGSKPLYIWRSILWSRNFIKRGVMWRMRYGQCIKAFSDNWILSLNSGRSSLCDLNGSILVKDSISPNRTWKENEVRELFPYFEADFILIFH